MPTFLSKLARWFRCHILRAHDWKRAVRVTSISGRQMCKRCSASRIVQLRLNATARNVGMSPKHAAPYGDAAPPSQWPANGGTP